jgi:hypothetical protein
MTHRHTPRSIDASLARSIRRGYFRRLAQEWDAAARRRERAAARNVRLSASIDNRRQLRQRLTVLEKLVGALLPTCTLRIESGTRTAAVVWALRPAHAAAEGLAGTGLALCGGRAAPGSVGSGVEEAGGDGGGWLASRSGGRGGARRVLV